MHKPILLGVDGESRLLIEKYNAGLYFEPENETDFLEKINEISQNTKLYDEYKKGCQKLVLDFDRKKLADKMLLFIQKQIQ